MDLSVFRHAELATADSRSAAVLDYGVLYATLRAFQAASATACAEARLAGTQASALGPQAALTELLLGGPGWRAAIAMLRGSFNHAHARGGVQRA